jgi:hypothetical protein
MLLYNTKGSLGNYSTTGYLYGSYLGVKELKETIKSILW